MKKSTLIALTNYFATATVPAEIEDAVADLNAERAKGEAKAQVNRNLYASAHDVVMNVITAIPQTVTEIYEACKDELPADFSKSKVQYALLKLWNTEITVIENAKSANQYVRA